MSEILLDHVRIEKLVKQERRKEECKLTGAGGESELSRATGGGRYRWKQEEHSGGSERADKKSTLYIYSIILFKLCLTGLDHKPFYLLSSHSCILSILRALSAEITIKNYNTDKCTSQHLALNNTATRPPT